MRAPPIQARAPPGRIGEGEGEKRNGRTAPRLPPRPANHRRLFCHEKGTDSAAAPAPSRKPSAPFLSRERNGQRRGSRAARRPHPGGKRRERPAAAPSRWREEGAARFDAARCCAGRHRAAAAGRRVGVGRERRRRAGERRGGERPQELGRSGRRGRGGHGARSGVGRGMCGGCRVGKSARWPELEGERLGRGAQVARLRRGRPIRSPASALWPAAPCRPSPSGPQRGAGRRAASRAPFRA